MPNPSPDLEISGPAVDDDIRRLIQRYGVDKVQEAIKQQTARRRGPIPIADWPELTSILREDARLWLEGGDPFTARSNRSIALVFAEKHPGHSFASTRDRLMRKLRERRRYYTLVEAERLSEEKYPYTENLRAIRALLETGTLHDSWDRLLRLREGSLADYKAKFGEPPASMTMQELVAEAGKPITPAPASNVLQTLTGSSPKR
ncbi:hypothetical protein [Sphingosinithalassobacter portus]|uniref:hypothetical protein n=1 Tax=Stakelama portus TaxID=2676234 RepID=UPI0011AB3B4F|nr:hypothetical protein [Sphingosinithalassobacter portus]